MLTFDYIKTVYFSDKQSFLLDIKKYLKDNKLIITDDNNYIAKVIDIKINKNQTILYITLDNNETIKYLI